MGQSEAIKLFEEKKVRTIWDDVQEKWYFSVLDVIQVLAESVNPTDYFKKMRKRDEQLASFVGTNCPQVLMNGDSGKRRKTLVGDAQTIFRIIQSIPSPKAEPSATELSKQRNPKGFRQQTHVAKDGGSVAKAARKQLERQLGRTIISSEKASDYILPIESKEE